MENTSFRKLMTLIEGKGNFEGQLAGLEEQYMIKIYKIRDLQASSVSQLYQSMRKKFYLNRRKQNQEFWYENELRIFIWLLFAYLYVHEKSITELNEYDWVLFSEIFNFKSTVFFEFQVLSIVRPKQKPSPWNAEETAILQGIMQQSRFKNRWNFVARQLFVKSGKRFFRNPKQCRERWMNHLDPSKVHTEWTPSEDLILLNTIKKKGKRWSLAVKELDNTRTEHMVKNRYKSLISNEAKRHPQKRQSEIENILIKKLTKSQIRVGKNDPLKQEGRKQNQRKHTYKRKSSVGQIEKSGEKEVKIENLEILQYDLPERYHLEDESIIKSPIFIPWKSESSQSQQLNLMEDEQMNIQNHLYGFSESQHQNFLRF